MLVVFAGLPGTGKSTLARRTADVLAATLVRIDTVEVALRNSGFDIGDSPVAYVVGNAVARDQLLAGRTVVIDAVNSVSVARQGWRDLANAVGAECRFVEVLCSDVAEHRRRVEERVADLDGHILPTWAEVSGRQVEPWDTERIVIDNLGDPAPHVSSVLEQLQL